MSDTTLMRFEVTVSDDAADALQDKFYEFAESLRDSLIDPGMGIVLSDDDGLQERL